MTSLKRTHSNHNLIPRVTILAKKSKSNKIILFVSMCEILLKSNFPEKKGKKMMSNVERSKCIFVVDSIYFSQLPNKEKQKVCNTQHEKIFIHRMQLIEKSKYQVYRGFLTKPL